jgi:hypothetical protein
MAAPAALANKALHANAIRLDVGGILAGNVANNALGNGGLVAPILVSYERQIGLRVSLVAEGLVNGGGASERKTGLSVQGRFYVRPPKSRTALAGFYLAPVAAFRSVAMSNSYGNSLDFRQAYLAGGALLGWQGALKAGARWFVDVSGGVMSWQRVGNSKAQGSGYRYFYSARSYYDAHPTDFDGRLGIGFWF